MATVLFFFWKPNVQDKKREKNRNKKKDATIRFCLHCVSCSKFVKVQQATTKHSTVSPKNVLQAKEKPTLLKKTGRCPKMRNETYLNFLLMQVYFKYTKSVKIPRFQTTCRNFAGSKTEIKSNFQVANMQHYALCRGGPLWSKSKNFLPILTTSREGYRKSNINFSNFLVLKLFKKKYFKTKPNKLRVSWTGVPQLHFWPVVPHLLH